MFDYVFPENGLQAFKAGAQIAEQVGFRLACSIQVVIHDSDIQGPHRRRKLEAIDQLDFAVLGGRGVSREAVSNPASLSFFVLY